MHITADTYILSDHHFGHAKIPDFEPMRLAWGDWENKLIENHNSMITNNDSVLFLGDFSWLNPLNYSGKLNGTKTLILGNHDRKGLRPYDDFQVIKGCHVDIAGKTLIYQDEDPLLSAIITEVNGVMCGFCHYTIGYADEYDDQRESAKMIKERKDTLLDLFKYFGVVVVFHGHLHSRLAVDGDFVYINTCVEHLNGTPRKIGELLDERLKRGR